MINPSELPIDDETQNDAQVCGCISAHQGLLHQKTKWETGDILKSQLNEAS